MTVDELRASIREQYPQGSNRREPLLAALDVVAVCHQGVLDGREPDTEEFVRALMAFHEAVST